MLLDTLKVYNDILQIKEQIEENTTKYCTSQRYGDTVVCVFSNEEKPISWINQYHTGFFESISDNHQGVDSSNSICIYGYYVSELIFSDIVKSFNEKTQMFFNHTGHVCKIEGYEVYFDDVSEYIHIVNQNKHYLLIRTSVLDNFRVLERIERECLLITGHKKHIRFHGGSFCSQNGEGVMIMGPKGAGKTSLLIGALINGSSIGANDRTEVYENNGQLFYCGVPTSMRLSPEQIEYLELRNNTKLINEQFEDIGVNAGKKEYSTQEIADYIGVDIANNSSLDKIIIPCFKKEDIKVKKITDREYLEQMIEMNLMIDDKAFYPYYLEKNQKDITSIIELILKKVNVYRIEGWLYDFDMKMLDEE